MSWKTTQKIKVIKFPNATAVVFEDQCTIKFPEKTYERLKEKIKMEQPHPDEIESSIQFVCLLGFFCGVVFGVVFGIVLYTILVVVL